MRIAGVDRLVMKVRRSDKENGFYVRLILLGKNHPNHVIDRINKEIFVTKQVQVIFFSSFLYIIGMGLPVCTLRAVFAVVIRIHTGVVFS